MTFHGEGVLVRATHLTARGDVVGLGPHRHVFERAPQPVVLHRIEDRLRSELPALAGPGQEKRCAAHAFHAAGDDQPCITGANGLIGEHDGLEPRAADLVDRQRGDGRWQAGNERRLASGGLAQSGGEHAAHDDFIDQFRRNARAADRLADDGGPQLGAGTDDIPPMSFPIGVRQPAII